jgi:Major royal jelly protein
LSLVAKSFSTNFIQNPDKFKNNSTIISTYHVRVDECDRLWVLDTGKADILGQPLNILPTSILIFDLRTDRLLDRIPLPTTVLRPASVFAKIVSYFRKDFDLKPVNNLVQKGGRR